MHTIFIDAWLSLVERCVRDAEVAGSNPVASTTKKRVPKVLVFFVIFSYAFLRNSIPTYTLTGFPRTIRVCSIQASFACFFWAFISRSLRRMLSLLRASLRLRSWVRSEVEVTTIPVGRWVSKRCFVEGVFADAGITV